MFGYRSISVATVIAAIAATGAHAGGFQRGTADTDILFEPGTVNTRASLTYVDPRRGFTSINGADGDFGNYTGSYEIPSYSLALGNEMVGCAAIKDVAGEGDMVICVGAGSITQWAYALPSELEHLGVGAKG